jgi:hypothetical protein
VADIMQLVVAPVVTFELEKASLCVQREVAVASVGR